MTTIQQIAPYIYQIIYSHRSPVNIDLKSIPKDQLSNLIQVLENMTDDVEDLILRKNETD